MRAVVDPNVIVSGLLSAAGAPAEVLRRWVAGGFEAILCPALTDELERVLAYPKIRRHLAADDADAALRVLAGTARAVRDPSGPGPVASADPDDDYLVALAAELRAALVSGDRHLLDLRERIPVFAPRDFLAALDR